MLACLRQAIYCPFLAARRRFHWDFQKCLLIGLTNFGTTYNPV